MLLYRALSVRGDARPKKDFFTAANHNILNDGINEK